MIKRQQKGSRKQTITIAVLAVLLIGLLTANITYAFFSDDQNRQGTLTFGETRLVNIGTEQTIFTVPTATEQLRTEIMPGDNISINFSVGLTDNSLAAWVRFAITANITEANYATAVDGLDAITFKEDGSIDTLTIKNSADDSELVCTVVGVGSYTYTPDDDPINLTTVPEFSDEIALLDDIVDRVNEIKIVVTSMNTAFAAGQGISTNLSALANQYFIPGTDGYIYRVFAMGRTSDQIGGSNPQPGLTELSADEEETTFPEVTGVGVANAISIEYKYLIPYAVDNPLQNVTINFNLDVEAVQYANNNRASFLDPNIELPDGIELITIPADNEQKVSSGLAECMLAFRNVAAVNP